MSAVCGDAIMRAGTFYAEFTILQSTLPEHFQSTPPALGVVAADYDASGLGRHNVMTGPDEAGGYDPSAAANNAYATYWIGDSPAVLTRGWEDVDPIAQRPFGFYVPDQYENGDVVGLLLDLTAGSLALHFNGERKGMLIPGGIAGPVKWAVEMITPRSDEVEGYDYMVAEGNCSAVRVRSMAVPPAPGADVLAAEAALAQSWNTV